jgi:D-aminopeptidase
VIGLGRVGCYGSNTSGDFVIAFSTATRLPPVPDTAPAVASMMPNMHMTPLFHAVAEATEAAVVNALAYSEMMSGHLGHVVHRMPLDRVEEILGRARAAG